MARPRSRVSEAVRDVVAHMIENGGGRASDGAVRFQNDHPDLLAEFGTSLAISHITSLIRGEFKQFRGEDAKAQPSIPGLSMARFKKLPVCISVPLGDGETLYRPLHRATMAELASCIGARSEQLQQDAAVLRDLRELHAERTQQGAEDEDLVFTPTPRPPTRPSAQPSAPPP